MDRGGQGVGSDWKGVGGVWLTATSSRGGLIGRLDACLLLCGEGVRGLGTVADASAARQ